MSITNPKNRFDDGYNYNDDSSTSTTSESSSSSTIVEFRRAEEETMSPSLLSPKSQHETNHATTPPRSPREIQISVTFSMLLNVVGVIGLVLLNKYIFDVLEFRFGTTLTCVHFIITAVATCVCQKYMHLFAIQEIPMMDAFKLGAACIGSIVFMNLNLMYNSVGFYQVSKLMTIPTVLFIEKLWYNKSYSTLTKLSLAVLCLGVGITSVTDVKLNMVGAVCAVLAVASTAIYQIWVGTKQKELNVGSFQLMYYQAPISAGLVFFVVPYLDNVRCGPNSLANYNFTPYSVFLILLSGVVAFACNISAFLIIGKTSPVTFQVLGHAKTIMIILLGFMFFDTAVAPKTVLGIVVGLLGFAWYTYIKLHEQQQQQQQQQNKK